ncbi:MAG: tyrosine-type recombinase/integrase [Lachnospiraceae bacterium]|nr:tyrosine-type recombinase/integrase [Lachnospiraceae bacterium]
MDGRAAKGQGSFRENPDGTITYRKGVGLKDDGRRKTLTVTGANRAVCMRLMKEKESAWIAKKNRASFSGKDTVEDLCTRHLESQIDNGELKPKSVDRREGTIKNQIAGYPLGHMQIQTVVSIDIEAHISNLIKEGLSVSSITKALDVINAAYEWGMSRGELKDNPVLPVKKGIKRRLSKLETKEAEDADVIVLSIEEEQRFEDECRKRFSNGRHKYPGGPFGSLLLHTGMRIGELISLRWSDYDRESSLLSISKSTSVIRNRNKRDGENNYISVQGTTKNQKARLIQLTEQARADLESIRQRMPGRPNDLICRTRNGNPYTATMMEHCMSTIYKHLDFDGQVSGLHVLRRTFATRMYENGAGVKEIAAYIGDLESTTMQYYIAARRKITVGTTTKQVVPVPGAKGNGVKSV